MTYDDALRLFRKGHFRELIATYKNAGGANQEHGALRALVAYVAARSEELSLARLLVPANDAKLDPAIRSLREITLGVLSCRAGTLDAARQHFQSGVRRGHELKDQEWVALGSLHLLRLSIEAPSLNSLGATLAEARAVVTRAGLPYLSAYLHVCVSTLEGQRGHFDEALRHCDIAESLLQMQPNAWVLGAILVNRGCIACFQCDFKQAFEYNQSAIELTAINGSVRNYVAAQVTCGHVQMLSGNFAEAQEALTTALTDPHINGLRAISAVDTLARAYLSTGELAKCEETLSRINFAFDHSDTTDSIYIMRWAALTKAKLLLRRGQYNRATTWITTVRAACANIGDDAFEAAVELLLCELAAKQNHSTEWSHRILSAELAGIGRQRDFQGQFYCAQSRFLQASSPLLSEVLESRATRIWNRQGIVSIREELGYSTQAAYNDATPSTDLDDPSSVANALAALFDLAYSPHLAGSELLGLIQRLGCAQNARLIEIANERDSAMANARHRCFHLRPYSARSRGIALLCEAPRVPTHAVLLGDLIRLARAAFELEDNKRSEAQRGALWPETELEEFDDGRLFAAEETKKVLDTARRAAAANIPILITGETGTGKEVLARLIHSYSPRAAKTFLPFNCSATPRDMLDSQLFGHRRGAFTGASENFPGVIRAAAGGTLFLDEIGESTLDIQPKLLRFLESGEVHPIGDTHPQRVDVRVLAATNADIDDLVAQGRFREDLFYRLNIVRLHVPPLRERRVEIPSFANHYLQKHAKEIGKGDLRLSEETMEYLVLYRWPGNVRQLANEMRRVAALAEPDAVIMPEHLSTHIAASRRTMPASERTLDASEVVVRIDQPLGAAMQHLERTMLQSVMAKAKSVDEAARLLGLSRKGLYLKRLRFGMEIDRPRGEIEVA